MNKFFKHLMSTIAFSGFIIIAFGSDDTKSDSGPIFSNSKSTKECKDDKRAYEFGREMYTWVSLRAAGLSLEDAINEYSSGLGINPPYNANDGCVQRGFEDASNGIESPYNLEGNSWNTFK